MPNRTDSILSQGMGKVKAMRARLSGLIGVFKTLAEQHGGVIMLLERAKASDQKFTELWPTIRRELLSHEQAEMRELYPVLRAKEETRGLAEHHDTEANVLEQLINEIDRMVVGAPGRRHAFERLVNAVKHHAREEEHSVFPKAQEALGKGAAEVIESKLLATKKQIIAMV